MNCRYLAHIDVTPSDIVITETSFLVNVSKFKVIHVHISDTNADGSDTRLVNHVMSCKIM